MKLKREWREQDGPVQEDIVMRHQNETAQVVDWLG